MLKEAIQEVRVFAPATVANVACGYDVLGFAIDAPGDEIVVRHCDKPGLHITAITGDEGKLPKNPEKNTAGVAALDLLRHLGMTDRGIEMEMLARLGDHWDLRLTYAYQDSEIERYFSSDQADLVFAGLFLLWLAGVRGQRVPA